MPFALLREERGTESIWNTPDKEDIAPSTAVISSEMPMVVVSFARYAPVVMIEMK